MFDGPSKNRGGRNEGYLLGTITPGAQKVSKADTVDDRRGAAAVAVAEHKAVREQASINR